MHSKFFACLAAVASIALAQPASAADMPTKSVKAPMAAPVYNWTGFYIGIEGGGGRADTQHTNINNGINSGTVRISGGLFGGTYGFNYQMGALVIGLEGDISWSGIRKEFASTTGAFCFVGIPCVTKLTYLGTDRVRLGYAWDRLLAYGTAGVAFGTVKGNILNAPGFPEGSSSRIGFIYGGGLEWAFAPKWSVKGEYLRTDFGDKVTYIGIESISLKNLDIVRFGLNYNFGSF